MHIQKNDQCQTQDSIPLSHKDLDEYFLHVKLWHGYIVKKCQ